MTSPAVQTERYLLKHEILTRLQLEAIHAGIEEEVRKAADEAGFCPAPDPVTLMAHICSDGSPVFEERPDTEYLARCARMV